MESELLPDKEIPPVPIKTYQWEDLRRSRNAGDYPWTHLLKPPLEGEVTAEDVLRESTPKRSMSREFSRSRTRSPVGSDGQKILNLDCSPGSSRKYGEEGDDEGVHIPNFSKEISMDSEDDVINQAANAYILKSPEGPSTSQLIPPVEIPKNVSPKGILKRRVPEPPFIGITETREKTKCCHPLVNKIKHLADKTLQKFESEKSPTSKRKKNVEDQEIRDLKSSPGAVRRQKFSAIKLGDSDEMSKNLSVDLTPPQRKKKEHIYEDIEDNKNQGDKFLQFAVGTENDDKHDLENASYKENDSIAERKSNASQDPSLVTEETNVLKPEDFIMEKLHKIDDTSKEAVLLEDSADDDEPNVDEVFQNQLEETKKDGSPNITITEILDHEEDTTDEAAQPIIESSPSPLEDISNLQNNVSDVQGSWSKTSSGKAKQDVMSKLRRWTSEGGAPIERPLKPSRESSVQSYSPDVRCACQFFQSDSLLPERVNPMGTRPTSRASTFITNMTDHEYEIIEKPAPNIVYTAPSFDEAHQIVKTDDELSSTTSIERKYLQHTSDEDEQMEYKEKGYSKFGDDATFSAEALQKDIEDRYFVNTPSTVSRTECEVSTSQVDSSALENLPLKRENRSKNPESLDSKIQQRIKEGTGKLKTQAGKLKTKLQNIKSKQFTMPERPKINLPDRPKFKMPERPKISFPDRPKFSLPDRRKFSLPDRPKFKKINISEKLSMGDRKKFSMPERPKFPDMPKFKLPERPKINFPSLGRKKEYKVNDDDSNEQNAVNFDTETKTYPRLFNRKKKIEKVTNSSPSLNREDTPPPVFTFTRMKKPTQSSFDTEDNTTEVPIEYGAHSNDVGDFVDKKRFNETYDFDRLPGEQNDDFNENNINEQRNNNDSLSDVATHKSGSVPVLNEIDNDEFNVRLREISRENVHVREYLSDDIRQAFNIPKNALALMGNVSVDNEDNEEADPELMLDENEPVDYEDFNDKDDGYYTFPPVRPSRVKRKQKELESVQYIDENIDPNMQFCDVELDRLDITTDQSTNNVEMPNQLSDDDNVVEINNYPQNEYENDEANDYPLNPQQFSQTLPMPPRRKRRSSNKDIRHSSLSDFMNIQFSNGWADHDDATEDMIVYRTEHEYTVPPTETIPTEQSPLVPRRSRNRSRSSHGTSFCDDDRTSQGADSLTLDTHLPQVEDFALPREIRQESPGYATVDKGPNLPNKSVRRSKSKTPPARRRKSNSSERKYYTVGPTKTSMPDRPPRKKSSTSLITLDSTSKRSLSGDLTQYDEIDEQTYEEVNKDLISSEVVNKMKDRPLPPPPRPPRGPKAKKSLESSDPEPDALNQPNENYFEGPETEPVIEIEVSTQTDPLPDDVDYELGIEENLDFSVSSSLRDMADEETNTLNKSNKSLSKLEEGFSRPTSRSEKSFKLSDPKISDLAKASIGRTSPTVILVERRVSSPTRINERDEMLTEASLTVQHIDVDEAKVPDVPPLPMSRGGHTARHFVQGTDESALERVTNSSRDIHLDNLVTQRLQVRDLDVGRLTVSELQASKILVSDIEGMTLQVSELDSKSGHISVSGIEFSQNVIDEIVKKFAEISAPSTSTLPRESGTDFSRPMSREEETQTDKEIIVADTPTQVTEATTSAPPPPPPPPTSQHLEGSPAPPQRPPPPDLTPLLYSYLQDLSMPPASLYHVRGPRDRLFTEFHESQLQSPPPPTRRGKRRPTTPHTESSSDEDRPRPSPRRAPPAVRTHEPTITEAGAQFLRVCQNSITRTMRSLFNSFMTYISGTDDKKDVQMALVIFLVLIAGLIMFGLSDSRTVHHHHWEFFNPPDSKP